MCSHNVREGGEQMTLVRELLLKEVPNTLDISLKVPVGNNSIAVKANQRATECSFKIGHSKL